MSQNIRINCLNFSSLLVFLLLFQLNLFAQSTTVDGLVDQGKKLYGAIAVLATKDGKPVYQKELGDYTINTQEKVGVASSWFTAALVMYMVDQGKIKLDDKVSKYLPIYEKYSKGYLTIRHCLSNTTGLEAEKGGIQKIFQKTKFASLEEQVNAFASKREIVANPGEQYYYSNIGLNIAARILEVVSKKSFDRLATEKLFRPVTMKKTSFANETIVDPTSGAISTAADYCKFLTMLMNKGTYNGKLVLTEKSVATLLSIQQNNAAIVYNPHGVEKSGHAFGSWVDDKVFYAPGFQGSFAFLDTCRSLAGTIVVKSNPKEEKIDYYRQVEEALKPLAEETCR
jgi:CubicO group peptidase (beta-lactamase class C family)